MTHRTSVAETLASWCADHAGGRAFLVPGGLIDPLVSACHNHPGVSIVVTAHEAGAVFAADGWARMRGGPSLALSIGTPGTTNLATALATLRVERVPVLVVTGDVPGRLARLGGGFQDAAGDEKLGELLAGVSRRISTADTLADDLDAVTEPDSGPRHLVIPYDVQLAPAASREVSLVRPVEPPAASESVGVRLRSIVDEVVSAERPLLLVGDGVRRARVALDRVVAAGLPVAVTQSAMDLLPRTRPNALGPFGSGGRSRLAHALAETPPDLLLVVGGELDQLSSGGYPAWIRELGASAIVVRRDPTFRASPESPLVARLLDALADAGPYRDPPGRWIEGTPRDAHHEGVDVLMRTLGAVMPSPRRLVVDAGTVRRAVGRSWEVAPGDRVLSSATLAAMGWSMGAGVGAALAAGGRTVVLVGDASMLMHGLELTTMVRTGADASVVVVDNGCHDSVRVRLETPELRHAVADLPEVDWCVFAEAFGVPGRQVEVSAPDLPRALEWVIEGRGPRLLSVRVPPIEDGSDLGSPSLSRWLT